jgi:hypothetical protein
MQSGKIIVWGVWFFISWLFFNAMKTQGIAEYFARVEERGSLHAVVVVLALLVWFPAREIMRTAKIKQFMSNFSWLQFLLTNIVMPIIVSVAVFYATGEPSITLVTVPIVGAISGSINLG